MPGTGNITGETLTLSPPAVQWLEVDVAGADVPFYGYAKNITGFSNLPNPPDDFVVGLGLNCSVGGPVDGEKPGFRIAYENAYKNIGDTSVNGAFEWHLETLFATSGPLAGGSSRRHISIWAPRKLGDGVQQFSMQVGQLYLLDHDSLAEKWSFTAASGTSTWAPGVYHQFKGNNEKVLLQWNAAGDAFLGIKLVNSRDEFELEMPIYAAGGLKTNLFNQRAHYTANFGGMVSGDRLFDLRGNGDTGANVRGFHCNIDTTGQFEAMYLRNGLGPASRELVGANGDAFDKVSVGATAFSHGVRNSDASWTLSKGGSLATPLLSVDYATGQAAFANPVKKPVLTVAALAAITPTAGLEAHCSDEAGGYVPVFADGTNWRRVTDRAIVS